MVLAAYVDESERGEDFYFLGALICTEVQWDHICLGFDEILLKHAESRPEISPEAEFHAYDLMNAKRDWEGVPSRLRFGIYREALRVITESGACVHLEGVDVNAQKGRGYPHLTPARELAFSHLFERINDCARAKSEIVHVYADDHHTKEISRSNFTEYQAWGTYGYKSSTLQAIHSDVVFIDSRISRTLQASDLVTYLYNRVVSHQETDARAQRLKDQMWGDIRQAVWRGGSRVWP